MSDIINQIAPGAFDWHINPVGTELREHRCACGRLLGRFSGQAEVKCPKCGKMNVIGVENCGK